ncbi:MAG: PilZ domain-containing protein [Bacillota bacterium]|nr:PilZ domain-containing protein [Bacillota bacterium]
MEERRRANRRELISKLVVKRLDGSANEEVEIDILDVSKSGIGFYCSELLGIGAVYEAFLRIWTQEVIHAFLEVVRIEKKANGYNYGAVFIGMPESDATRIEVYDTVERMKQD